VLIFSLLFSVGYLFSTKQKTQVIFFDVGQGDSIFIQAEGRQVLIDGGRNKQVLRELSNVMPFFDRSIDVVVVTHSDIDHIGGIYDVLERYKVGVVILSQPVNLDYGQYVLFAREGMSMFLTDDAWLDTLFPDRNVSGLSTNDASIVSKLYVKDMTFLLTGDSSVKIENFLLSQHNLKADVLKVGHHGSRTSTSEDFLKEVSPLHAVISVGRDNTFGHPHSEVINRLQNMNTTILSTDKCGSIFFHFKKDHYVVKTKKYFWQENRCSI
jgi:competence protein ComEC